MQTSVIISSDLVLLFLFRIIVLKRHSPETSLIKVGLGRQYIPSHAEQRLCCVFNSTGEFSRTRLFRR
jgi:hypothetical protein